MRYIVVYGLPGYSKNSPVYHNQQHFRRKKGIELEMNKLTFSTLSSETFLILRRTERDMINNV
jgi:hypothetical protein